ncbi:MAG: sigma-70 family RNA polymerase sigma factor [Clostridia bacterium]|nr:sigma-70 family RNA polymerase sigma factor [Clostridia bacterium]
MKPHDLEKYTAPVFRFCLVRLNNIEDARDLAQDILCEALASLIHSQVEQPDAWLWRIARNRYCRRIRQRSPVLLDDGTLLDTFAQETLPDQSEEKQVIFAALHSLANSHRQIMIDFYVNRLSTGQIAAKYGISPATVRSRLFYGREKLRKRWVVKMEENRIYSPQEWFVTGNGDVDPSLLSRQIVRSIAQACYERPLSIEEISLQTGIPCLYIEDELPNLLLHEILERQGERYLTSMVIYPESFSEQAEALLLANAAALANRTCELLRGAMPAIRSVGFYGNDLPESRLFWSLIPMLLREACAQARMKTPDLIRGAFPLRTDGGCGWLCAYASPGGTRRWFSGCNAYHLDGSRFRYYWSQSLFSEELNQLLRQLENVTPGLYPPFFDGEWLAKCVRCDLAVHQNDSIRWHTPVLSGQQAEKLKELLAGIAVPLADLLVPISLSLYDFMKNTIPSRLHPQIRGLFGIEFNSIIDMICCELLDQSILESPTEGIFAGQVIMLESGVRSVKL